MSLTLRELAALVQGEVVGDGEMVILGAGPMSDSQPGQITFLEDSKYLPAFLASANVAAVVSLSIKVDGKPTIRVNDPLLAFITIFQRFHPQSNSPPPGIHPAAHIHPSAHLGEGVTIEAGVMIGENCWVGNESHLHAGVVLGAGCRLGDRVTLHPHVVLYPGCLLGSRVIIHANAVIGADGFGYRLHEGSQVKIPQLGHVEIGDDVEIGACTTIDRGTFGATRIGSGTKTDNLVMVAHNCQIGKHNIFASHVAIAGSVTTGDYVVMGGQAGVVDHLFVGEGAMLGAQTGLMTDAKPGEKLLGTPGRPLKDTLRIWAVLNWLPEMRKDLRKIKEQLASEDDHGREEAA